MDKKAVFQKIYANLPLGARQEIVAVLNGEPLSWNAAWLEIDQDTQKAKEILDYLFELRILKYEKQ